MWAIQHPQKVFKEFADNHNAFLLLKEEKYYTFSKVERDVISSNCKVKSIQILNPNNPAKKMKAILIKMKI